MSSPRRAVITGIGLITPCGVGLDATWSAVAAGQSGIGPITRFDAAQMRTRIAGEVRDFVPTDFLDRKTARRMDRTQQLASAAADLAVADAAYALGTDDPYRAGVIIGSCVGGLQSVESAIREAPVTSPDAVSPFFILQLLINMSASYVSIRHGFKGPNWATNSACATSAHALGEAARTIQRGEADVILAGGAEAPIGFMAIAGFNALRALSTRNGDAGRASRPFDRDRDGFVLSEGAAVLLVEERQHALDRGARIHAELIGYGTSADAFHVTSPSPGHLGAQRCMRAALSDAGIGPDEIDYINAHATSTPLGDIAELDAIAAVFGDAGHTIPISSTKSMMGHLTGAAGAAEAAIGILAMSRGWIPPTINLEHLDTDREFDCVPQTGRRATLRTMLTNSFGFGGTNASLVFRKADE